MTTPTPTPGADGSDGIIGTILTLVGIISGPLYLWYDRIQVSNKSRNETKLQQEKASSDIDSQQAATMKLTLEAAQQAITNYNTVLVSLAALQAQINDYRCETDKNKMQIEKLMQDKSMLEVRNQRQKIRIDKLTERVKELEAVLRANNISVPVVQENFDDDKEQVEEK